MEEAASKLFEASVETHQTTNDPYLAQLAKTKAARVESAAKLLERAGKDPKVQKVVKRTARKGKGKGRGKASGADDGKGVTSKDNQGDMEGDDTKHSGADRVDDETKNDATAATTDGASSKQAGWDEKET